MNYEHDSGAVRDLYEKPLQSWNAQDASGFAALFSERGIAVGFDGSQMDGPAAIRSELEGIFANHQTAQYVSAVREVRFPKSEVAILRAVAGMVPPGKTDLNQAVNAIQTMVGTSERGEWRIELFQNTPAAFHGRPELSEALTEELSRKLD